MKSCSLMLLAAFFLGVVVLFSDVRRAGGLVGEENGVSANDELPRGSGDEGTDVSGLGGMLTLDRRDLRRLRCTTTRLVAACIQVIQQLDSFPRTIT